MNLRPMSEAPRDGTPIRVHVMVHGTNEPVRRDEFPWLIQFIDNRWCYHTTWAPLHSWHEPLCWTDVPRLQKQNDWFGAKIRAARGSNVMPSADGLKWARRQNKAAGL